MKHILFLGFALTALSACSAVVAVPHAADEDAPAVLSDQMLQSLQPGDTIKLTVYGEDTLSDDYKIDSDGFIALPLLGKMKAAGHSKEALQDNIAAMLKQEGYLTSPLVTVDHANLRPVYVMGETRNPGSYDWQPNFTAFQAVASAGGYTPRAAQNQFIINRHVDGEKKRLNANEETPVLPGDSITVRERIF